MCWNKTCMLYFLKHYFVVCVAEPATVQNPSAVHSARDDFLKVCFKFLIIYHGIIELMTNYLDNQLIGLSNF